MTEPTPTEVEEAAQPKEIQNLAYMLQVNDELMEQAIENVGPASVAAFFIAFGWGLAAHYNVTAEEIERINSNG